ncbi:hypothetical protein EPICR_10291 [Candidatus Desulfarcum epimagneticum]|uniref:Peptidoglycan binding-like domain-containing protein n=1 Tax=uncultured Desulfobacteraceae bacterium TaxID=218296 RepID=A0A484HEE8_9BACT|nr:hypothetical protein EPICR_10291 [uncultured Desulfobacteraceae bacterium]
MSENIKKDLDLFKKLMEARKENLHETLRKDSPDRESVALLQRLLNDLGHDAGNDGIYTDRTRDAVNAFVQNITAQGSHLPGAVARAIVDAVETRLKPLGKNQTGKGLTIKEFEKNEKPRVTVSLDDVSATFARFKKGMYTAGKQKPSSVIQEKKEEFKSRGFDDSEINVIMAVSENEGNLDAINTWDNSFLSFGMFQWTAGAGKQPGELAALLKRIKDSDESLFEKHYGRRGLDITPKTSRISGFLTLDGKEMASPVDKSRLRSHEWAFYFWLSGQDFSIQLAQVEHAISRINSFYRKDSYKVKERLISELITSEYGVALILDNHINRPGYIQPCLEEAMDAAALPDPDPSSWKTEDELKLLDAYLNIRETYGLHPMTHAEKRAKTVQKYRDSGVLSDARGSFGRGMGGDGEKNDFLST